MNFDWRPYNSIRFICRCGRRQTFPRSPAGGVSKVDSYELPDGTKKIVTETEKTVKCPCGLTTSKARRDFRGR